MIDQVTSWFNIGAIIILWLNIRCLLRDKQLKGYSIYAACYFASWALWGIYMYWKIDLIWSMIASCVLLAAYICWIGLILWYRWSEGLH